MIILFLSLTNSLFYRIIWILFVIPYCVSSADELHRRCSQSFSCGDQTDLFYPFWIPSRVECGHPDFQLQCSERFAEVSISSVKFRILEANSTSRVIRLARSDYIGGFCPQHSINAQFNENVLPFVPGTDNLTIYYGCSPNFPRSFPLLVGELDCGGDDEKSYYVTTNLSSPLLSEIGGFLNDFSGQCKRHVSIPATGPALITLQKNTTQDNLKKTLQEGFNVGLNHECLMCIASDGACGYNRMSNESICHCIHQTYSLTCRKKGMEIAFGLALLFLIVGWLCSISKQRKTSSHAPRKLNIKALIPVKHYSYVQVKRITKSFSQEVGKGGFGTVYRGTLCDGRKVAVKVLKNTKGNGEDFLSEVASMSETSHVNIVTLLGFCAEGTKRAIICEFLENGALDKFIAGNRSSNMEWTKLYEIALGVARGLEYLHHGCRTRIVHFDIKPQNVLLDDNLCPKISDFGLAKLCERKESILSLLDMRGTIGYIAPEVFSRVYGRVSHKSDVYSYGMLVLEMMAQGPKHQLKTLRGDSKEDDIGGFVVYSIFPFRSPTHEQSGRDDGREPGCSGIPSETCFSYSPSTSSRIFYAFRE
uniref:non-specific serine/threonine protein kinase n=1 Tax=Brassica campestris TaxID=3711 RepID=M4FBK1_BRACM